MGDNRRMWTASHFMTSSERVRQIVRLYVTIESGRSGDLGRRVVLTLTPDEARKIGEQLVAHSESAVQSPHART